ncbi:anti-sigma factor family protein [Streptomyces leeuwenhoekii]|uniref:anti-sigma factor family protein n=1 Tax=Streptomyces leeuwenhoekii TaxID=1437453 RepID=UPI003700E5B0
MTSPTDMAGHPDVAEISDLAEGLLPPSRTTDVRQHLDACELCADVYASLEEIRGLLGTLPGPPSMPADVAGRIDAALAAEALLDATAPEPTTVPSADAVATAPEGADHPPVSRETPASADRPSGKARRSSTGPGRKGGRRSGRRRLAALGAVFAAATLGIGAVIVSSLDDGTPSKEASGHPTASADTFSEGKLRQQVSTLLAESRGTQGETRAPRTFGSESGTTGENHLFTHPAVPECVQRGIGRETAALATEEGVYQGRKALLVILPEPSDDRRVTVYIVEATCVDQPSAGTARVLLERSYTR